MERKDEENSTDEIEITPEMIEAGRRAFHLCDLRDDNPEDIVAFIFEEMSRVAPYFRSHRRLSENNTV
jgi:hypothetical protein